ncbi:putative tRNA (cytidine(34)-2'-O)-methyltransferase [Actinomycetota bacterium]|nr:putative tRNA (cytidine(34)-2'-O)-methyltransferase [Actinomycetota bacterium]
MSKAPDIAFLEPRIPGNTGNAMRLSACVGNTLHLIEPLGFEMDDSKLKRAGLDYHDLSHYRVYHNFDHFLREIGDRKVYAFSSHATQVFADVQYGSDDLLLFGPEPTGLPEEILEHPSITKLLKIPMQEGVRSLNLSVSASIAVYEAWRQLGY